jgi:DNA-binding PadR family transcriptional regulator
MDYKIYAITDSGEEVHQDFEPGREDAIVKAIRLRKKGRGEHFVVRDIVGAEVFRVG